MARSDRDFVMDEDDAPSPSRLGGLLRLLLEQPVEIAGSLVMASVVGLILTNALFWQQGQHPAPLFRAQQARQAETARVAATPIPPDPLIRAALEPARVAPAAATVVAPSDAGDPLVRNLQIELAARGQDVGDVDGVIGRKTDAAIRAFQAKAGLPVDGVPSAALLARVRAVRATGSATATDPIARLLTTGSPPADARLLSVERTLAALGYGPLKIDGVMGNDTRSAIERFERDRGMSPTGAVSQRLVRELGTISGTPLE